MSKPINVVDVARNGVERDDGIDFNVAVMQHDTSGECLMRLRMSRQGEPMLTLYFQTADAAEAERFADQTKPMFRALVAVHVTGEDGNDRCL